MKRILPLLLTAFLVSCDSGYIETNDGWTYVVINEGGKTVFDLNADPETFRELEQKGYAADKNTVFYQGHPIEGLDPTTVVFLKNINYLKDANAVFFKWEKIHFADPNTFKVLSGPYSKDKQWVFNGNLPMIVDKIEEFKVTESSSFYSYYSMKSFTSQFKEYQWLDTTSIESISVVENAKAETKNEKYVGFKKVLN